MSADRLLRRPQLVVFDVNETLSDLSSMAQTFAEVGLPEHLAATWFAGLLRDGFALTVTGENPAFADLAEASLAPHLHGRSDAEEATANVMGAFMELRPHLDVADGIRALAKLGIRLVTLSNGSAAVAQALLEKGGIGDAFERLLSVADAPAWKPAPSAYEYALRTCGVRATDAMLVAVHPWDIHGAHAAGLSTAWINRSRSPYPATMHAADLEVDSLTALAARLGTLSPS